MFKSLALLVCGTLTGTVYATYGDYPSVFQEFLRRTLPKGADFTLDSYDVVHRMEYPSEAQIGSYDGVILTGSAASAYENVEWINKLVAYVAWIVSARSHIKIIGICFGHQIVARALGGECVPNNGKWEVGPTTLDLTDLGKQIFGVDVLNIQQMHRDHVPTVPRTFYLLGSTPGSFNQGLVRFSTVSSQFSGEVIPSSESAGRGSYLKSIHIFTVQGHPEYSKGIVSGIVEQRLNSGIIDMETAADFARRKDWRDDGVEVIGKTIWGILGVTA